ncbi:tyrosine-type recombinase/integrase [Actinoplanes philippinensis]|uniref:tyrosine-type recombinase/integrase n=1 Tax=Actinoplanes philippinensis TaxID=35752 RepID=UPI0033CDD875
MAVDDLWYLKKRGPNRPDGKPGPFLPSKRHGRGKRWRVRYTDDTGQPRERLFDRKPDAERWDATTRADVARGVYVDPDAGKVTVKAYGEQWRANQLHRDSTAERVERALRVHVYPVIGGLPMARVRRTSIQTWVKDRAQVLEPSTLRVVYSYLASMFLAAAIDRVIGVNPCQGIHLPDVPRTDLFVPTTEQVYAISDAFAGQNGKQGLYQAQPLAAAATGLRQGELWGLELEHVDFLRRKVIVAQQLKVIAGRRPFLAPPKTPESCRTVDLSQVGAETFAQHIEAFSITEVEIDDETNPRKPIRRKAKLIFLNGNGDPVNRSGWSHLWTPAVARAGLPKGFGFHALRHYFATVLIHGGASVKTVQLALGHTTPTITLNTYVGHWPDAVETTRTLIDSALRRPTAAALAAVQ